VTAPTIASQPGAASPNLSFDIVSSAVPGSRQPVLSDGGTYARLRAEVIAAGILDRSLSFYLPLIFIIFAGYAGSIAAIFVLDGFLFLTLACLSLSFFTVQQAGLMHDSGHRAVFRSKALNDVLGLASCAAIGMVFANWTQRHNTHHAHSNREGMDPDMEVPFIAITKELFESKDRFQRALGRWQVFYYYPLGCIVGFSNRLGSLSYFVRNRSRATLFTFCLYLPAMIAFFILPFVFFSLEKATFVFLLVHLSTGIYLANCFAPNHKAMPVVERGTRMSFIEQQVTTSRNVRGGRVTDVLLVGLNYQVDHHLFPSCPRNKLHLLKPYVQRACEELGLPYNEAGFIETNRLLLRQLRLASRA